jgi:CHASE2 domain-containing sensor protein/tRNA A-37 threonylcarbamoyl transferase component Bud32
MTFWKSDRAAGLALSLLFLAAWLSGNGLLQGLERDAYDLGVSFSARDPGDEIVVVAIDDDSIRNIGRWPWPRSIHATLVDKLGAAGAKVIGSTIFYTEAVTDPGLMWIRRLKAELTPLLADEAGSGSITGTLNQAEAELDTDRVLAESIARGPKLLLPMYFESGEPLGKPDAPLPAYVARQAIPAENVRGPDGDPAPLLPHPTVNLAPPIAPLGEAAVGLGHLVTWPDVDGDIRFEPLVVRYYDAYFPSLSLAIAAASRNLGVADIKVSLGEEVGLQNLRIKTDGELSMGTFFYGPRTGNRPPFDVFSALDLLQDEIPAERLKDRIVLIGATAFGVGSTLHTPTGDVGGPVMVLAHNIASILNQNFFIQPGWSVWAQLAVFLLVTLYLVFGLPRLSPAPAALVSAVFLSGLLAAELLLMRTQGWWLQFMTAASLLALGHILLTTKRYVVAEVDRRRLDVDSAASNRQLALQFQQKGELDMAFDYFRKCPVDASLLEAVYNLAADFESRRKFNKASAVYQFIAEKNPDFRDIKAKVNRSRQLEETVLIGGSSSRGGASLLLDGSVTKPMLGRYAVEKELGKGAMGVVYLGKDPKINRVVAIKTMALSEEFEADELDEVKARFFREAETAGRLQHPNIVTIYDAGEEHDLAYIAMEFLEGHDLVRYTKGDNLLPVPVTLGIIFKAALALDYAHKANVVHRDIKPANIMYEPGKKAVKLTDFGIARITDSSRTKTGMVLGTPSYMSPEQLAGKKVDGRSDLFSLGVMLYQMLTGRLPFVGDSMATLMYRIANDPHPPLAEISPELVTQRPTLPGIIDKALQKNPDLRYQTGAEMARDLQACAQGGGSAP